MFNREFRHEKTFKLDWSIAADSFEKQLRSQGAMFTEDALTASYKKMRDALLTAQANGWVTAAEYEAIAGRVMDNMTNHIERISVDEA